MKSKKWSDVGEWVLLIAFLFLSAVVFEQIWFSLAAQHAASGNALSNAALFPSIVAWLIVALVVLAGVGKVLRRAKAGTARPDDTGNDPTEVQGSPPETLARRLTIIIGVIALTIVYLAVLSLLGFRIATFAIFTAIFLLFGARPWWRATLVALGLTILTSIIFEWLLNVVLPVGRFDLWALVTGGS